LESVKRIEAAHDENDRDAHQHQQRLGVDYLPLQIVKHRKRRPFYFNIMVCGESGLGKTTLLNTLFNVDLFDCRPERITERTVSIVPSVFELEEEDVQLVLTLVDAPGFGDQLNRQTGCVCCP
jgi:septin family protein